MEIFNSILQCFPSPSVLHHQWKGLELVTPFLALVGSWRVPLLRSPKCFVLSPFGNLWFGDSPITRLNNETSKEVCRNLR